MKNLIARAARGLFPLLALALTPSCGTDYSTDAARAFKKLFGSSGATVFTQRLRARELARHLRAQVPDPVRQSFSQDSLRFLNLSEQSLAATPNLLAADTDYSCSTNSSGATTTIACTCNTADVFSCQGTQYTWAAGSTMNLSFTQSATTFAVGMTVAGTMAGGEFDTGVSVSCSFNFSFDVNGVGSGELYDIGCSNFRCSIDGDDLDCEDFDEAFRETADSC
jgi:hypothetical protein